VRHAISSEDFISNSKVSAIPEFIDEALNNGFVLLRGYLN